MLICHNRVKLELKKHCYENFNSFYIYIKSKFYFCFFYKSTTGFLSQKSKIKSKYSSLINVNMYLKFAQNSSEFGFGVTWCNI